MSAEAVESPVESRPGHAAKGVNRRDLLFMMASSAQLIAGTLVTPLLTRVLSPSEYGRFAALLAVLYIILWICSLGLNVGLQRIAALTKSVETVKFVLGMSLILVAFAAVVIFVCGPLWAPALGFSHFGTTERLTVIWGGLFAMTWVGLSALRYFDRLLAFSLVSLIQSVLGLGVGLAFADLSSHSVTDVLYGCTGAQLVALLVCLASEPPSLRNRNFGHFLQTLRFSLPLVPNQLATFVISAADRLIVQHYLGETATGRYQVAYNVGAVPVILCVFYGQASLPRVFAAANREARLRLVARTRHELISMLLPITLGLGIGGPIAMELWAPKSFHVDGLVMVMTIIVLSAIPSYVAIARSQLLLAEGRSLAVALATAFAATLNVVLNFVFLPKIGLNGSAIATLISYVLLAAAMYAVGGGKGRVWVRLSWRSPNVTLSALVLLDAAAVLFAWYLPLHGIWLAVRLVASLLCLVALVVQFKRFTGQSGTNQLTNQGVVSA